jgi:zinc/manganese transport system permease protein
MVLPAATARFWVRRLVPLLACAVAFALFASASGLLVSYHADWPTSPVIVLSLGAMYLLSMLFAPHGLLRQRRPALSHLKA